MNDKEFISILFVQDWKPKIPLIWPDLMARSDRSECDSEFTARNGCFDLSGIADVSGGQALEQVPLHSRIFVLCSGRCSAHDWACP